jgi:hypothetical protein
LRFTIALVCIWPGGGGTKLTDGVVLGTIAKDADKFTAGSEIDVAVIVTVVPGVVTGGAVYVAGAPLADWNGTMAPQPPSAVLLHFTVQVTPPGAMSLATTALRVSGVPPDIVGGGAGTKVMDGGNTRIVVVPEAVFCGVVAGDDAVMVTVLPAGMLAGAV